ncbi:MAG: triose-phosphate isomerase [Gemmatimonadales bacterium]|nr:triose-phosphate isomerase [Gemmatimonadales bacterium]NIN50149.1 triose-phosphate isomerase [Gemmatimonadales bacterium]NIP07613.1 triose-phosphate isomerase [Gemmatimonadales bacterium]NIR01765.1 triose-phosphate isomerase [Gemmatimonadales bacterium]NIS65668.1 triose-phosphate isomerase [Gemmatimonadales bacterium]
MKQLIFAANWKMHLGPDGARAFLTAFLEGHRRLPDREVWFFPSAVALEAVVSLTRGHPDIRVGVQNVYWEPKGAFTGELGIPMAREGGAEASLVGHSERRHIFGETDAETGNKVRALLEHELIPMLCVGEKIDEREAGETLAVVERQLGVLQQHDAAALAKVVIAYEPVWAIGTGKTATPSDASQVHAFIRGWFADRGVAPQDARILYGGSVKPANIQALVSDAEIDGVLVGGASLDPGAWSEIVGTKLD